MGTEEPRPFGERWRGAKRRDGEGSFSVKVNEVLLKNARELRKNLTRQERHLWYDFLRGYPVKIYKQKPIGPYIVDFCCPAAKLIVELDGGQHYEGPGIAYDQRRDSYLSAQGFKTVRYSNLEVDQNFSGVCAQLGWMIHERVPSRSALRAASSPRRGEPTKELGT